MRLFKKEEKYSTGDIDLDNMRVQFQAVDKVPPKKEFIPAQMKERTLHIMQEMSCMVRGQTMRVPVSEMSADKVVQKKICQRVSSSVETAMDKLAPYKLFKKELRGNDVYVIRKQ